MLNEDITDVALADINIYVGTLSRLVRALVAFQNTEYIELSKYLDKSLHTVVANLHYSPSASLFLGLFDAPRPVKEVLGVVSSAPSILWLCSLD